LFNKPDQKLFENHPDIRKMLAKGGPDRQELKHLLLSDPVLSALQKRNKLSLQQACDKVYTILRDRRRRGVPV